MQCRNCWLNDYKRNGADYCMLPKCPYIKRGDEDETREAIKVQNKGRTANGD